MPSTVSPPGNVEAAHDHQWSTDAFDDRRRMSRWSDVVSRHMTEMDVGSDNPRHYRAQWQQSDLGPVQLNFIAAMPQHITRTPAMVARSAGHSYELIYLRRGRLTIRYRDRDENAGPGEFALLRNAEPYEFICPEQSEALTVHLEDRWLRRWLPDADCFSPAAHKARNAWGAPLAAALGALADHGVQAAALPREVLADQLGSLLALLAGPAGCALNRPRRQLLARLRGLLGECFAETDLDPAALARAAGISTRHLHGTFARAGTSFGRELMSLRLRHGESLLRDGRYASHPVNEIAYLAGFADPSHFARRFRARYGSSPAAYRAR